MEKERFRGMDDDGGNDARTASDRSSADRSRLDETTADTASPIRVYVATTEEQMLAVKVLEYSIRKHASLAVELMPLHLSGINIPRPADRENLPRTPFSFQRFAIPEIAGYTGRAIYLDSDMQVFQDIRELWAMDMHGAQVTAVGDTRSRRPPQFSVMLLDCAALNWDVRRIVAQMDEGAFNYRDLMQRMVVADRIRADIPSRWNALERFDPGHTALLHYTDIITQPWVTIHNANGYLWVRDLIEAVEDGFISSGELQEHIARGYARPSLTYQVEQRHVDPLTLPRRIHRLDHGFQPPYLKLPSFAGVSKPPIAAHRRLLNRARGVVRAAKV